MKKLVTLVILLSVCLSSYAKEHILKSHVEIVMALSAIKSNSESIKPEIKGWSGEDSQKGKALYFTLKSKNDALIDKYKAIIPNWRKARKLGLNVDNELKEVQAANNEFVKFFTDNYLEHDPSPRLNITAELVNIVFEAGKKIYDFVKNIDKATKDTWSKQVEEQRIEAW